MKKWYVITGILAFLLLISLVTCSLNSGAADRAEQALASAKTQLTKSGAELDSVKAELTQLKSTKSTQEISFGNGLKVFGVSLPKSDLWSPAVSGKVQNTSNLPMKLVFVIVAAYDKDGTLKNMSSFMVSDLYPNEVAEWSILLGSADSYAVYAFGVVLLRLSTKRNILN